MTTTIDELGGWPTLLTELLDRRDLPAAHARAAMATSLPVIVVKITSTPAVSVSASAVARPSM